MLNKDDKALRFLQGIVIGMIILSLIIDFKDPNRSIKSISTNEIVDINPGIRDSDNSVFYVRAYRNGKAITNEVEFNRTIANTIDCDSLFIWQPQTK